jgi:hypothetical protein
MNDLFKQEGYELVGAAMEVYNVMGPGYLMISIERFCSIGILVKISED